MIGVCVMQNGRAPLGWVEIQRDDESPLPDCDTDFDAAQMVCDNAKISVSHVRFWHPAKLIFSLQEYEDCIVVVPAPVAMRAALINVAEMWESFKVSR